MTLSLPVDAEANELVQRNPLALLVAMVLDQQVPLEKAFSSPYELVQRLGHEPDARELADYDTEALIEVFAQRPALHRFPKAMAARVQEACRLLVDKYDGDPTRLWSEATDGKELLKRVSELPGFGSRRRRSSSPCSASSTVSSRRAGGRQPVSSGRKARTSRSPTSSTPTRS